MRQFQVAVAIDKSGRQESCKRFYSLSSFGGGKDGLDDAFVICHQYGPYFCHFLACKQIVCFKFSHFDVGLQPMNELPVRRPKESANRRKDGHGIKRR